MISEGLLFTSICGRITAKRFGRGFANPRLNHCLLAVGYQNQKFGPKFNYVCNTFLTIGKDKEQLTLGDIKASDDMLYSMIEFLTNGGANNKITVDGLGTVTESYTYWADASWTEAGVAGWYLYADENAKYPMNDKIIPFGHAFCLTRDSGEADACLIYSGECSKEKRVLTFGPKFNYVGNCAPKNITLGDIVASDDMLYSMIEFLTNGGANNKVTVDGLGTVTESYTYWADASWTEAGVAGWYLYADENAKYPMNEKVINAGEAFCLTRDSGEASATLSMPSAL